VIARVPMQPPESNRPVDHTTIVAVADRLAAAYATGPIAPIRTEFEPGDVVSAYAVQRHNTQRWIGEGRRVVGRKIGLTNPVVQRQFGVDQPDFGALFADMCLVDGEPVAAGRALQARVEGEVALVVGRRLDQPDLALPELLRAVEFVLPAIEVVGSRIAGWDISIVDTVADNASSALFVLGTRPVRPEAIELGDVTMQLSVDGVVVSQGTGRACLGHPYRAALWLARRLAEEGDALEAGDVVMTGSLGPMASFPAGTTAVATFGELGEVRTHHET